MLDTSLPQALLFRIAASVDQLNEVLGEITIEMQVFQGVRSRFSCSTETVAIGSTPT